MLYSINCTVEAERMLRYMERSTIYYLKQKGWTNVQIAEFTGHHRDTIARVLREDVEKKPKTRNRSSAVAVFVAQAPNGFRIALLVFRFESGQIEQGTLLGLLFPDARQLGDDLLLLAPGNGTQDVALLVNQAPLTRRGGKERGNRGKQAIVPVGDQQIDLAHATAAQILQQTTPALLVFLGTGSEGQHFSASF